MTGHGRDEAFMGLSHMLDDLFAFRSGFETADGSIRSVITGYSIETPIELDVYRDDDGAVGLGITPPLYRVDTSLVPSFHQLRLRAELDESDDD